MQFRESLVPEYNLPPVLQGDDPADWKARRQELLRLFQQNVYGQMPAAPTKLATTTIEQHPLKTIPDGVCLRQQITVQTQGGPFEFEYLLYGVRDEARPVFVMINNRARDLAAPKEDQFTGFVPVKLILDAGFSIAVFQHSDVAPDNKKEFRNGLLKRILPSGQRGPSAPGAIAAWAWGASRVLDSLVEQPLVDARQAAVIGHSRGGKTALVAGAFDERFSLVISNNSGCGGAALCRRQLGERIANGIKSFPFWYCPRYATYVDRENELPVDQHQLIALSAPRHVYVASADQDLWADPRGEWLGLVNAHPAFKACRVDSIPPGSPMPGLDHPVTLGSTSYHVRSGIHNLTEWDWREYLAVARRVWAEP